MREEIMRITTLLEQGKISAEQATALITALSTSDKTEQENVSQTQNPKRQQLEQDMVQDQIPNQMMLQVRVLSEEGDRVKVNLPLGFVKGILKISGKLPMVKEEHMEGVNMEEMMEAIHMAIDQNLVGRIVDIETAKGDLVIVDIVNGHA